MSINKELCLEVADAIEQAGDAEPAKERDYGYNQCAYMHECGTPSCIAGWTVAVGRGMDGTSDLDRTPWAVVSEAVELLGLGYSAERALFCPYPYGNKPEGPPDLATAKDAARTLRRLAETGKVDWTRPEETGPCL